MQRNIARPWGPLWRAAWLILFMAAASRLPADSATLHYRGLDKAHLSLQISTGFKLVLSGPSGYVTEWAGPWSANPVLVAGLEPGSRDFPKDYSLVHYEYDAGAWSPTGYRLDFSLDGSLEGALQFDELCVGSEGDTLSMDDVNVQVPDPLKLEFRNYSFAGVYTGTGNIDLDPGATLQLLDCHIEDLYVTQGTVALESCYLYAARIYGGAVDIEGSEIVSATIHGRFHGTWRQNLIIDGLEFQHWPPYGPALTLELNSFVGQAGIRDARSTDLGQIDIGSNYWGDKRGPRVQTVPASGDLFGNQGAAIVTSHPDTFQVAKHKELRSDTVRDRKTFPRIWIDFQELTSIVSTHNLVEDLQRGRKAVLSVLPICDVEGLGGVEFYLELRKPDGSTERIDPQRPLPLRRDLGRVEAMRLYSGTGTLNFLIPAYDEDFVTLWLKQDTTGVSGYEEPGELTTALFLRGDYRDSLTEPLRLRIVPLGFTLFNFPAYPPPSAASFRGELEQEMIRLLGLREQDLEIDIAAPVIYENRLEKRTLLMGIAHDLWLRMKWNQYFNGSEPHMIVAMLPKEFLGKLVGGVNMASCRRVLFCDAGKPRAAIHEMLHYFGYYTGTEQYDLYPPDGLRLMGQSTFDEESGTVRHYPAEGSVALDEVPVMLDVMGGGAQNSWIVRDSLDKAWAGFRNTLALWSMKKEAVGKVPSPDAGDRSLILTGEFTLNARNEVQPVAGSLRMMAVDAMPSRAAVSAPIRNIDYRNLKLESWGAGGWVIDTRTFSMINASYSNLYEGQGAWWLDVTLPSDAVRVDVYDYASGSYLLSWKARDTLEPVFQAPADGADVTDGLALRWELPEAGAEVQPIQYLLLHKAQSAADWSVVGRGDADSGLELDTDFMAAQTPTDFRLFLGDGFQQTSVDMAGLVCSNRPPEVAIRTPESGMAAVTGTSWTLQGSAFDPDGDALTLGWESSRDGTLGSGERLEGVILSEGTHLLTLLAEDAHANQAASTATVTVEAGAPADLKLDWDDFQLVHGERQALGDSWAPTGSSVTLALRLRGAARPVSSATLRLFITEPGRDDERQLAGWPVTGLGVQDENWYSTPCLFVTAGEYELRGEIETHAPADPIPGNNTRGWHLAVGEDSPLDLGAKLVAFGQQNPEGEARQWHLMLRNPGPRPLWVNQVDMAGSAVFTPLSEVPAVVEPGGEWPLVFECRAESPLARGRRIGWVSLHTSAREEPLRCVPLTVEFAEPFSTARHWTLLE